MFLHTFEKTCESNDGANFFFDPAPSQPDLVWAVMNNHGKCTRVKKRTVELVSDVVTCPFSKDVYVMLYQCPGCALAGDLSKNAKNWTQLGAKIVHPADVQWAPQTLPDEHNSVGIEISRDVLKAFHLPKPQPQVQDKKKDYKPAARFADVFRWYALAELASREDRREFVWVIEADVDTKFSFDEIEGLWDARPLAICTPDGDTQFQMCGSKGQREIGALVDLVLKPFLDEGSSLVESGNFHQDINVRATYGDLKPTVLRLTQDFSGQVRVENPQ